LWLALACLPLAASLVLSFRRSFWIGGLVGVALVVVFALSPTGRRLIVPAGLLVAVGIALLGSISIQSQSPLAERVQSLNPTHVEANAEDRYRLDERANVVEEIKRHPISGLGVDVPWSATVRSLPVEHQNGRLYTHVVTLYLWLKLGILGPIAYLTLIAGAVVLSWRAWRRQHEPLFRCFGLASLCGLAGLFVIETTASFTGVDVRFTVMLAAELGLLGALAAIEPRSASAPRS
jgi:O-antigen ligase